MGDPKSYYKTLGISSTASDRDVKQAYRALSMEFHPDRNKGKDDTTAKFQKIGEAYEILGDATSRTEYDASPIPFGINVEGMSRGACSEMDELKNIINMMFNGGIPDGMPIHVVNSNGGFFSQFSQMQKPVSIIVNARISMEQCYTGCDIIINENRWRCSNNGEKIYEHFSMNISIPPGMDDNDFIHISQMGNVINEQTKGDIKVMIQVTNDTDFVRYGCDLILKKKITLKESLCGFIFTVRHLNGRILTMDNSSISTIIQPRYRKIIPGLGMIKKEQTGNIIIEFDVIFPESLTQDQIEKLKLIL